MKVLINAVSAKLGGAASYVRNLARELADLNLRDEFIFCVPEAQAQAMRDLAPIVRVISTEVAYSSSLRRLHFDHVALRRIIKREKVDVLYSTANLGVFACPCAQVLLVRNSLHFSELYLKHILPHKGWRVRLDDAARRRLICESVKWADVVMTPSRSMLDELRRFVEATDSKFVINPYGTIPGRFRNGSGHQPGEQNGARRGRARLLHVSHYADHKNLGVLFKSLELLSRAGVPEVTLSTTADVDDPRYPASYCRPTDRALLRRPAIAERVRRLGDVPHQELPALYRAHDLFIFPSLTESYGHPLVEAMASGLPVVAADTPVSRELCGDAALYFAPFSAEELALKVERLVTDEALRKELAERGLARALSATWRSHVLRLLDLFGGARPSTEESDEVSKAE